MMRCELELSMAAFSSATFKVAKAMAAFFGLLLLPGDLGELLLDNGNAWQFRPSSF